jgi:hypothetical protein
VNSKKASFAVYTVLEYMIWFETSFKECFQCSKLGPTIGNARTDPERFKGFMMNKNAKTFRGD